MVEHWSKAPISLCGFQVTESALQIKLKRYYSKNCLLMLNPFGKQLDFCLTVKESFGSNLCNLCIINDDGMEGSEIPCRHKGRRQTSLITLIQSVCLCIMLKKQVQECLFE